MYGPRPRPRPGAPLSLCYPPARDCCGHSSVVVAASVIPASFSSSSSSWDVVVAVAQFGSCSVALGFKCACPTTDSLSYTGRCVSRSGSDTYPLNGIPFQFGSTYNPRSSGGGCLPTPAEPIRQRRRTPARHTIHQCHCSDLGVPISQSLHSIHILVNASPFRMKLPTHGGWWSGGHTHPYTHQIAEEIT